MRERIEKLLKSRAGVAIDRFCNSPFYAVAIGAACIISHTFDIVLVGALLLTLLLVPALLFCDNSFVLTPFLMMCSFVMSENTMPQSGYYNDPLIITALCFMLAFMVAAFAFNLVYYGKWKKIFKKSYLAASICLSTGALVIGGIFSETYAFGGVLMAVAIMLTMLMPYLFMLNCGKYEGKMTVEYFAWSVITASVVIGAAVLKQYIDYDFNVNMSNKGDALSFGFAISNTAAAIVVLALPATFYLAYKYKYGFAFLLLVALELGIIYLTYSRASQLVAFPGALVVAVAICFKKRPGRMYYVIACAMALAAVAVLVALKFDALMSAIKKLFSDDPNDRGRFELWQYGLEAWKNEPVFGVGLWYLVVKQYRMPNPYFSFHSTPLTYLYCAGVIGLTAYLYHRYKTVRIVFSGKPTAERVFVALGVLAMVVNALLDIAMTLPINILYYSIMLALIESDVKKTRAEAQAADNSRNVADNNTDGEQAPAENITEGEKI